MLKNLQGPTALVTGGGTGLGFGQFVIRVNCDVADTALYLCSDQSRWVTGQIIGVDGGLSLHVHNYEELSRTVYGDELVDSCKN